MRLTVVGCAGSFPGPEAATSCYLVEADDAQDRRWRLLIDLGNGALGPLQRVVRLRELDAVLLSHLHADHCLDACGLYVVRTYDPEGRHPGRLPVHGPRGTLDRLDRAYDARGDIGPDAPAAEDADRPSFAEVFDVREWAEGTPVRFGPVTVTAYRVRHPVETYGLRLEHGGRVLAFSGDTDTCPALATLARGADLLLAEASFQEGREDAVRGVHLTGRRAGQVAAEAGAGRLLLTHIPAWTDPAVVSAEAREVFAGPVLLALPGDVHEV
ncbi:MAG: MBL fold metallo-hydrolase [Actinomycetales bacterium]|nr:MBL fold metallo-hydrolase [Actinomycetales bacterium]